MHSAACDDSESEEEEQVNIIWDGDTYLGESCQHCGEPRELDTGWSFFVQGLSFEYSVCSSCEEELKQTLVETDKMRDDLPVYGPSASFLQKLLVKADERIKRDEKRKAELIKLTEVVSAAG